MADSVVLADGLAVNPEWRIWCQVFSDMLAEIDLSKLLVYMIDTVDASVIPTLAEQFDVLGYNGMRMAQTEAAQRALLKNAIVLHKYKGTEWAITQALQSLGFTDIRLKKGLADGYDHWAKFGIEITNTNVVLTEQSVADITAVVNAYKRAVCVLEEISMTLQVNDTLNLDDLVLVIPALVVEDILQLSGTLKYDGSGEYDGTYSHNGESDVVIIN